MNEILPHPDGERLQQLLPVLLERPLSDSEREELQSILYRSAACRSYYLEYIDMHTLLDEYWGASSPVGLTAKPSNRPATSSPAIPQPNATFDSKNHLGPAATPWFNINSALLASCIVLLVLNLLAAWLSPQPELRLPRIPLIAQPAPHAPRLVATTACVWHGEDLPPAPGRSLEFGERLDLVEGIAEFQVQNQANEKATIRIEGPASIFIRADGQIELRSGVLVADIDARERPFRVDLPNGTLTLTGQTSIGVNANALVSELHVFEGTAQLEQSWATSELDSVLKIDRGEAVIVEASESGSIIVERTEADDRVFASKRTMYFDRLMAGERFEQMVRQAQPDIYWKFEGEASVANETGNHNSGQLKGEVSWRKFNNNISPEFGLSTSGGLFVSDGLWPPKPLESYTVEMWLKPSHYHNGAIFGMCDPNAQENGRQKHAMLVEIGAPSTYSQPFTRPNKYRFLHRSPPEIDSKYGTSCYSESEYAIRQWQHVVARKSGDQLSLFINGELSGTAIDPTPLPANMRLFVGQLYAKKTERPFVGQIDELAVYSRSLSDAEILEHFSAAQSRTPDEWPIRKEN